MWRAFPLHPETPEEGRTLEELFKTDTTHISRIISQLKQHADQLGLPFGDRHMTFNSRLAQELGLWAEDKGYGHAFHMEAFTRYFAESCNLAKHDELLKIVESCNLPRNEALDVIANRSYKDAVDRDWERSRKMQITAVPTFIIEESRLVGAQNYANLQGLMLQHGVVKK
nr:DsbA family protein [Desulfosediminicola flagellatus]